jgi:spermidine synthase
MDGREETKGPGERGLVLLLFSSGAAALAHEVAWVRLLEGVFGTTAGAAAVVLACFMAGMGLGGLYFGRLADGSRNGLRLYALLELAAGGLALLVPLLVWLSGFVYGWVFRAVGPEAAWALTPVRIVLSSAALLPPAFCLGGTLPPLVRFASRRSGGRGLVASEMGRLYAANTAGAVAGCFVTGFVLLGGIGLLGTVLLAAAACLAVGGAALGLSRGVPEFEVEEEPAVQHHAARPAPGAGGAQGDAADLHGADTEIRVPRWRRLIVPCLYAASGLAALACEILWTRALAFVLRSTVYAFTSMLTVFLAGLAAGGAVGSKVARGTRRPAAVFCLLELAVAASVVASLAVVGLFATGWTAVELALLSGWTVSVLLHLLISAAVMLLPTFLMGMLFPVAGRLHSEVARAGSATGELLFANTLGGVAGSLAAGFVLVPLVGTAYATIAAASVFLMVAGTATAVFARMRFGLRARVVFGAALLSVSVFVLAPRTGLSTSLLRLFEAANPRAELVYADEGPDTVVTVHSYPEEGYLVLSTGGVPVAGTAPYLRTTQVLQALIPTLLHPSPERILQVGLGTGETARVALDRGARDYTGVEISPGVVRAARLFFGEVNEDARGASVLDEERFRLVLADGTAYVRHTREEFDLVLSESTYPFLSGSSGLYTLDYLLDCRARLGPGGMVSVWLPLDVPAQGVGTILRTFAEAFPHATFWSTNLYGYKHALLLGSERPIRTPFAELGRRLEEDEGLAHLLAAVGVGSAVDLASCLMLDRDGMLACAGDAPLHTVNRPVLEYATSRRSGEVWQARLAANMEELGRRRASLLDHVSLDGLPEAERAEAERALEAAERESADRALALVRRLRREAAAFPFLSEARAAARRGHLERAALLYEKALDRDPEAVEAMKELWFVYVELGRRDEARELERAIERRAVQHNAARRAR